MSASGSVPAGTHVGRYEIVSLLRQGGMGEVYAAHDRNLGRDVALKILPRHRTSDPDRVARFVREARASSSLNHPSIVAVHDAGSEGDVHFLAMELIDGLPLSEWMRKRRSVESRVEVMAQVAEGLARAHDAGIVHRDLKPDNIMVTRDGRAKIVDFGVAKLTERASERGGLSGVTTPTSRVGTTAYMSPEQVEGRPVDHRADVFGFGAVLYELLTGTSAFGVSQYADTIHNVVHLEPPLEQLRPSLRRVVRRCLRKEPELRYDSLRDVALDLREAIEDGEVARRPARGWWLALALLPLLALGAWFLVQSQRPAPKAMKMTRLTNSGRVTTAAISPDGKYLVLAEHEGDQQALYMKQIATGTVTKIAGARPIHYYNLQVSPDGTYAYYAAALRTEPNVVDVYQLPLLGGTPRRIAADTEQWYSISPDGTKIVFVRFNVLIREFRMTVAAVDGSGERVVLTKKFPEFIDTPVWSPDGWISFLNGNLQARERGGMFRLSPDSRKIEKIATPRFPGVGSYAWLADGSGALATVYDREQPPQIWYVPNGDTVGRKVTSEVSAYFGVTPTADSSSFSAVRDVSDPTILTFDLDTPRGEGTRVLTSGFSNWVGGAGVRWLNSREVLFSAVGNAMNTFYVVDANGGEPRRLIHNMAAWNASISPDGTKIAFISDATGTNQVWIADANGANPRRIATHGNAVQPAFTADGRSIVFIRSEYGQYAWRVPVTGGEPVRITDRPVSKPLPSPDGKWLLCRIRSTEPNVPLWRTALVSMDGSAPTRYFDAPHYGGAPVFQWHPTAKSFLYVDYAGGIANFWIQDLDGSPARQLSHFEAGEIYGFDVSRDGRRIAFSRVISTRDAVLIRDFR